MTQPTISAARTVKEATRARTAAATLIRRTWITLWMVTRTAMIVKISQKVVATGKVETLAALAAKRMATLAAVIVTPAKVLAKATRQTQSLVVSLNPRCRTGHRSIKPKRSWIGLMRGWTTHHPLCGRIASITPMTTSIQTL